MEAIQKAGMELADLKPEELKHMSVDERIELLKSNIVHFTAELLHYDVMEIRLLDRQTGRLEPLLAVGIEQEAALRSISRLVSTMDSGSEFRGRVLLA